ncbi:PorP/SprF family type IX secretion system membrane protein [Fibrella aquatica]|jgi:type IX secretion system PorP/SprF family membrane protein|uniref:PorP/SprF family type IX secretion system membrane protein n=1 Tax=Fibrella aquatica TaxID=3242487 RepID=UPI003522C7E3
MCNKHAFKLWAAVLLLTLGVGSSRVQAQQDKMFSQYMFNMMALNPAYAGSRDVLSMTALYRAQWIGLEGAPQTATFTADMPLNRERVGVGIQLYNDRIGQQTETGAYASYAFRFRVGERSTLSLGLTGGVSAYSNRLTEVVTSSGQIGPVDPAFATDVNKMLPNFGTGIYISNDRSYLGVSVPRLLRNNLSDFNAPGIRSQQARQAYAMAGFVIGLSPALKLKPSMLVKYSENSPLGFDGNVNLWINDRVAIGTSYRRNQFYTFTDQTNDAVVGMLELQLSDQFRFGYAYDRTLNNLGKFSPNSHEVMIRYELGFNRNKILTPRYF